MSDKEIEELIRPPLGRCVTYPAPYSREKVLTTFEIDPKVFEEGERQFAEWANGNPHPLLKRPRKNTKDPF